MFSDSYLFFLGLPEGETDQEAKNEEAFQQSCPSLHLQKLTHGTSKEPTPGTTFKIILKFQES
jgi:hypothetical protein